MAELTASIREESIELAAYLEQTVPLSLAESSVTLGLEPGHVFEPQLFQEENQAQILKHARKVWGENGQVELVRGCREATPDRTLSAERARERKAAYVAAIEEVKHHPRVQEAAELFGARVKNVTLPEGQH